MSNLFKRSQFAVLSAVAVICFAPHSLLAQTSWQDDIGWTQLRAEFGGSLADGTGIIASYVEGSNGVNYMPFLTSSEYTGKTFHDGTGNSNGSSQNHTNNVSRFMFGNDSSVSSGVTDITAFDAGDWLNRVTGLASGGDPLLQLNGLGQTIEVQNHSYVSDPNNPVGAAVATNLLQRLDFMVNRDNTTVVVGTNNGSASVTPEFLAPGYNTLTVGTSNGAHARGETTFYGAGRTKPEIVSTIFPNSGSASGPTSFTTATVSGISTILRQAGAGTNAAQNESVKALLLAGATKDEADFIGTWSQDTDNNLDSVYGVGEVNIYNSYKMLVAGEGNGSSTQPIITSNLMGYDYEENLDAGDSLFYDFDLSEGAHEVSIALTWNILVEDQNASSDIFDAVTTLNDLDLRFYDSTGSFLGSLIDSSVSEIDNIEHLYLTDLASGLYTLEVSRKSGGAFDQDFAVAWRISPVPEPGSATLLTLVAVGLLARRRRS